MQDRVLPEIPRSTDGHACRFHDGDEGRVLRVGRSRRSMKTLLKSSGRFADRRPWRSRPRAKALRAEGRDVIGFGAGEPDFDTPNAVKLAAWSSRSRPGHTKYAPTPGNPGAPSRRSPRGCASTKRDRLRSFEHVVVTVGAKHAAFEVMQCLVDPGDEVVVITPAWLSYRPMVELAGRHRSGMRRTDSIRDSRPTPQASPVPVSRLERTVGGHHEQPMQSDRCHVFLP